LPCSNQTIDKRGIYCRINKSIENNPFPGRDLLRFAALFFVSSSRWWGGGRAVAIEKKQENFKKTIENTT
jgi:hypothetical protein